MRYPSHYCIHCATKYALQSTLSNYAEEMNPSFSLCCNNHQKTIHAPFRPFHRCHSGIHNHIKLRTIYLYVHATSYANASNVTKERPAIPIYALKRHPSMCSVLCMLVYVRFPPSATNPSSAIRPTWASIEREVEDCQGKKFTKGDASDGILAVHEQQQFHC